MGLPKEIQDKIYDDVLGSLTGRVELRTSSIGHGHEQVVRYGVFVMGPGGCPGKIRLSFFRTCKQVYNDCREKFWAMNILHLNSILPFL
ncbi:hypothetical protein DL98DRAFT_516082 [Cadophora sp. DSE1049]|nr:hypothetical protein DL98DRAFT_516082 [Cadophora sp. DSE1049]